MARLVSSYEQVQENIVQYRSLIKNSADLQGRLPKHRAWYAIKRGETWLFGNSKIIGYSGLTAEDYLAGGYDGRQTEAVLQKWFVEVRPESEIFDELWQSLAEFLADYGKAPSKLARINVLKEELRNTKEENDDAICELIFEVARAMDTTRVANLRKKLKTLL